MIDILHHIISVYTCNCYMYYTTRDPILLVFEVYIRSCRISIINSSKAMFRLDMGFNTGIVLWPPTEVLI